MHGRPLRRQDLSAWKTILDCNLYGGIHGVMAVLPHMLRRGSGHIVNTASVAGLVPPEAVSIDQAGIEILAGLEKGMAFLPIVDFAREMHRCVVGGEPARIDATMRAIAGNLRARLEAMNPPRR